MLSIGFAVSTLTFLSILSYLTTNSSKMGFTGAQVVGCCEAAMINRVVVNC